MGTSTAKYERLDDSSEALLAGHATGETDRKLTRTTREKISDVLLGLAVIAAAVSLILSAIAVGRTRPGLSSTTAVETGALPRPNAYIGLEKVKYPANISFPPIVNYALSSFQFQVTDSKRRITEDDQRYKQSDTTVVPEVRRIVVSSSRSTVIQFRAKDWGMERCVLHLNVPEKDYTGSRKECSKSVEIWSLEGVELLPHIAWKYAPARRSRIGTYHFTPGQSAGEFRFTCPSGSFPTFELGRAADDSEPCELDFWQDHESEEAAIHIKQHWSRGT